MSVSPSEGNHSRGVAKAEHHSETVRNEEIVRNNREEQLRRNSETQLQGSIIEENSCKSSNEKHPWSSIREEPS